MVENTRQKEPKKQRNDRLYEYFSESLILKSFFFIMYFTYSEKVFIKKNSN